MTCWSNSGVSVTEPELNDAIAAWVNEYGWGGIPRPYPSTNFLQSVIDHKGFAASSGGYRGIPMGTVADEVEAAVCKMECTMAAPGEPAVCFRWGKVLRVYYLTPKYLPEEERLRRLKAIGLPMSRRTYQRSVRDGREYLMALIPSPTRCAA